MAVIRYADSVFINCPFDAEYQALFRALVFAVSDCGLVPRCTLEVRDGSRIRISNIYHIIAECQFGIHDISRTELDPTSNLPRFNMPLELGLFLGAKQFGTKQQQQKMCLILDRDRYRYQQYCSDIAGQDIEAHHGVVRDAVVSVRNWLRTSLAERGVDIPSGSIIYERYTRFLEELPVLCAQVHLDAEQLIFTDLTSLIAEWLRDTPAPRRTSTRHAG